jgi:hypothetical protein
MTEEPNPPLGPQTPDFDPFSPKSPPASIREIFARLDDYIQNANFPERPQDKLDASLKQAFSEVSDVYFEMKQANDKTVSDIDGKNVRDILITWAKMTGDANLLYKDNIRVELMPYAELPVFQNAATITRRLGLVDQGGTPITTLEQIEKLPDNDTVSTGYVHHQSGENTHEAIIPAGPEGTYLYFYYRGTEDAQSVLVGLILDKDYFALHPQALNPGPPLL